MRAPFPAGFRGADIDGVDLVMLDSDVAGVVQQEVGGGLDHKGVETLWWCIPRLDKVLPLIDDDYCASYYTHLRTMARVVAARHTPSAT